MVSPTSLKFGVLTCSKINEYSYMIVGELVPFPMKEEDNSSYNAIVSEICGIAVDGFLWPRIGWSVCTIPGIDMSRGVSYGNAQYIPSPLGATVPKDISSDDLLSDKRSLGADMDDSTRVITSSEGQSLFVRA